MRQVALEAGQPDELQGVPRQAHGAGPWACRRARRRARRCARRLRQASRFGCWKTQPGGASGRATRPVVCRSRPATMRRTVDLPQPDGPTSEMKSAAPQVESDAADGNRAARPGLSDAAQLEHRAGRIRTRIPRRSARRGARSASQVDVLVDELVGHDRRRADLRVGGLDVVAEGGVEVVDDLLHALGHHVAERLVGAVADDLEFFILSVPN